MGLFVSFVVFIWSLLLLLLAWLRGRFALFLCNNLTGDRLRGFLKRSAL